jgi:predicted permease
LIGAGLFLRSLLNAQDLKPGFEIDKLMVMTFDLGSQGYDQGRTKEFYRRLRDRLDNMPELESAAIATNYPLGGGFMRSVSVEGQQMRPGEKGILTLIDVIDLKYFQTAGIALAHGRNFTDSDRDNTRPVAVITEAMAHRFWPNEDAIGKRFKFFGDERYLEVVGIVKDSAQIALGEEPTACVYLPLEQNFSDAMTLYARAKAAPQSALAGVRGNVQELDNNLPITNVATMPEIISQNLWGARMSAILLLVFGLLALMLAAIGIYGILAYSVSQRTQEIGIRMALGAQRGDVLKMVLKQAMLLVALGILLGLASSLALAHFVSTLLFGISAFDPVTFIIAPAILAVAGFTASLLPARKATRVDPIVALRWD